MARERILVIDDEPEISELIRLYLTREQYEVYTAPNGQYIEEQIRSFCPDLIILDILMPGADGLELCRQIRKWTNVPVIFVSCKAEDTDKIVGLTVGGDDYITKPFSPGELVARVKAQLRRQSMLPGHNRPKTLVFGDLTVDLSAHEVKIGGQTVPLSATEFSLVVKMAEQPGRVFSIDELFDLIWGADHMGDTRTVMVHISNLRKKIEPTPANPKYILTVRGVGYKFSTAAD
ncbi:response regulator [Paenibacillus thermoaerophilus]|uniref:Response regulator n=1 Tax=Paenibacillus thermoaerophilus TaxID=1215385 RepID=A0ABW2V4A5_9BACL|nr:response regulator transcription factor [Paenibacillus thermoaerophilus]TMV16125.1 response regulator transcription factor [Paenibacillus thermoaerophilus]